MVDLNMIIEKLKSALPGMDKKRRVVLVLGCLATVSDAEIQDKARGKFGDVQIDIRRAPARLQCMTCFGEYHQANPMICPFCGGLGAKVLSGEECFVETVEMLDE